MPAPAPAGSLRAGIPQKADRVILRMLDREPNSRPAAQEVWEVLRQNEPADP